MSPCVYLKRFGDSRIPKEYPENPRKYSMINGILRGLLEGIRYS